MLLRRPPNLHPDSAYTCPAERLADAIYLIQKLLHVRVALSDSLVNRIDKSMSQRCALQTLDDIMSRKKQHLEALQFIPERRISGIVERLAYLGDDTSHGEDIAHRAERESNNRHGRRQRILG